MDANPIEVDVERLDQQAHAGVEIARSSSTRHTRDATDETLTVKTNASAPYIAAWISLSQSAVGGMRSQSTHASRPARASCSRCTKRLILACVGNEAISHDRKVRKRDASRLE